jgi:aryl-alcohol dehydrogenase-like predicted oxidoreductase
MKGCITAGDFQHLLQKPISELFAKACIHHARVPFEKGVELAEELSLLKPEGMTLAQMALRWILDIDAVTVVIPGASRPSQVSANASISKLLPLSSELHAKIQDFYESKVAQHIRGPY